MKKTVKELLKGTVPRIDLIDAHYIYPDGVAAVKLGNDLNIPTVVTARGSDINLISNFKNPQKMMATAFNNAGGIISVCEALKKTIIELFGIEEKRINVLTKTPWRV